MFCSKCGSPVNEGEKFCSVCGQKVEAAEVQQDLAQPNGAEQPYGQQPYGNTYGNVPKKSNKGLLITLGLVAVLAIAAVLIFVVFGNQAAISQGLWPFKGDTTQTRFVNDTVRVFSDAFAGLGNEQGGFGKMAEQPFDITADITAKVMGQPVKLNMDMAYDEKTLGMNINAMGTSVKMLLLEDVLYMDMLGNVQGIKINSAADLSKPMSLQKRLIALGEGVNPQAGALTEGDYIALAELFVNSIDEKCFNSSDSKSTLTLGAGDVAAALRTFAAKLDADKELKGKLENYIKNNSQTPVDVIKDIKDAADSFEQDLAGFSLVWEISFENEKPVSFEIKAGDGTEEYNLSFGYKKDGGKTDISFKLVPGNSSTDTVTGTFSVKRIGSGIEYEGAITMQGETLTISGNEKYSGNKAEGTVTISIPGAGEISLDYEATVSIGMPAKGVKDDKRFKIDTDSATVTSMPSGIYSMPGVY